jgi:hypothetical protein
MFNNKRVFKIKELDIVAMFCLFSPSLRMSYALDNINLLFKKKEKEFKLKDITNKGFFAFTCLYKGGIDLISNQFIFIYFNN